MLKIYLLTESANERLGRRGQPRQEPHRGVSTGQTDPQAKAGPGGCVQATGSQLGVRQGLGVGREWIFS